MDWWMISEVRLPPNPSYWLNKWQQDGAGYPEADRRG